MDELIFFDKTSSLKRNCTFPSVDLASRMRPGIPDGLGNIGLGSQRRQEVQQNYGNKADFHGIEF